MLPSPETPDPKAYEARVRRSREAVAKAVRHIVETEPVVRPKGSPIAAALSPHLDEIRAAMARGWSAGRIAALMAELGVEFGEESMRIRIRKMFAPTSERPEKRDRSAPRSAPRNARASAPATQAATQAAPPAPKLQRSAPPSASATQPGAHVEKTETHFKVLDVENY